MWPPEPMSEPEPELDCTTETSGNLSTGDRENNHDWGGREVIICYLSLLITSSHHSHQYLLLDVNINF